MYEDPEVGRRLECSRNYMKVDVATQFSRSSEGVFGMSRLEEMQEEHAGLFKSCSRVLTFLCKQGDATKGF